MTGAAERAQNNDPPPRPRCRVCRSYDVDVRRLTRRSRGGLKTFDFHFCGRCGFISNPKNRKKYTADGTGFSARSQPKLSSRAGDGVRAGREYFMLRTAMEILDRSDLRVLFFGSGLSRDHDLARRLPEVATSKLTDLHNYQDTEHFIPLDSSEQFDVVISCEVVEHFSRPRRDFRRLLGLAKSDGVVVCSTNVNDGTPLDKIEYPWTRGHLSYYSGNSLIRIARQNGMQCDFRLPEGALRGAGPRKRYVFFFSGDSVGDRIREVFARVPFAPSESVPGSRLNASVQGPPAFGDVLTAARSWTRRKLTSIRRRFRT